MKKTILGVFLIAVVLSLFVVPTAATESNIMPIWDNVSAVDLVVGFDGSTGYMTADVSRQAGVTSMEATVTVYRYSGDEWVYVDDWYKSTTRNTLVVTGEFNAVSGVQYKAEIVVTAYRDNTNGETVTHEIIRTCP